MARKFTLVAAFVSVAILCHLGQAQDDGPPPIQGGEIQTRGPIHEAFAQPLEAKPEPSELVPRQPPEPVPELPPDERPEGDHVQWIPGYWAWDGERKDYLWVSGVYRNAPQGKQFVAGYWTQDGNGWRWVPGYWLDEQRQEVPYVPEPPAPLDLGPQAPAPNDDAVYVPGSWRYRDSRYLWQPGYWSAARPGVVWVPPRYVWTPSGYIFIDGFWDWALASRGLVFAPVALHHHHWVGDPNWVYRPSYVVNNDLLFDSCFHHRRSFHFYFGNYYGNNYVGLGYRPWYETQRYSPVFVHHGMHRFRDDRNWVLNVQRTYNDRALGRLPVPPRSLAQQNTMIRGNGNVVNNTTINNITNITQVVAPIKNVKQVNNNVKLVKADATQVNTDKQRIDRSREISALRKKSEGDVTRTIPPGTTISTPRPMPTFKLPALSQNLATPTTGRTPSGTTPSGTTGLPKSTGATITPNLRKVGTPSGTGNTGTTLPLPKTPITAKDPVPPSKDTKVPLLNPKLPTVQPKVGDVPKLPTVQPKISDVPKQPTRPVDPPKKLEVPRNLDVPKLPTVQPKITDVPKQPVRTVDPPRKVDVPKLPLSEPKVERKNPPPTSPPPPKSSPPPVPSKSPMEKKKAELPRFQAPMARGSVVTSPRVAERIVLPATPSRVQRIVESPRLVATPKPQPVSRAASAMRTGGSANTTVRSVPRTNYVSTTRTESRGSGSPARQSSNGQTSRRSR